MTEVADLYVVLRSVGTKFEEGMARAGRAAGAADSKIAAVGASIRTMGLAAAGGGVLVAGAAIKMSSEFDRLMEQLHTLAHVPERMIAPLGSAVLKVAGDVGTNPNSLAEALYHVESTFASTGITGKKAMDILTIAAKGAQIGGANLVDVTNSLDAAVVSGIPGVKNINQAMGALLATVGAGDMTMQNLANALGTGILAVAKQYGVTLADVGASLATFGDNNIRGSKAATDLRMAIMDLTKQSSAGEKALSKIGIASGELGDKMRSGGLKAAIEDLVTHLHHAGVTGTAVGKVLTDAFTKRASAPLAILIGELGQFESKYPELKKGANSFGDSWAHTAALISTRAKQAKANVEAAFIGLGHMLTPFASAVLNVANKFAAFVKSGEFMKRFGGIIKDFVIGALVIVGTILASIAIEAAIAAAPFIALALAIGYVVRKFMDLYEHNAKVREFVDKIVKAFKKDAVEAVHWLMNAFQQAKRVIGEVIDAIVGFYEDHKTAINKMVGDVVKILGDLWSTFKAAFNYIVAIVRTAVKVIEDLWARFGKQIWQHIVTAWNAIVQVVHGAFDTIKGIFEIVTGILTGDWSKFWKGIKDFVSGIWDLISGVVKTALNLISTIIGAGMAAISAAWGLVWHTIENLAKHAWQGIKDVGKFLFKWFVQLPWNIVKAIGNALDTLYNVGKDFVTGLWNGIVSGLHLIWDWANGLGDSLFNVLDNLYNDMLTVGKDIITGIWNGIAGAASWLWDKVKGWASGLWSDIKGFFGIGSPSKLMRDTVGKHLMTGVAEGIVQNKHYVHNAMKQLSKETAKHRLNVGTFGVGTGIANGHGGSLSGKFGSVSGNGNTIIIVQGSIIDYAGLYKAVQTSVQQHGGRNPNTGLVFKK